MNVRFRKGDFEMDIAKCLSSLPCNDGNFKSAMNRATDDEIEKAIEIMKTNGGSHKGRILACERELRKRKRGIKQ